jgi:hypothetical protein
MKGFPEWFNTRHDVELCLQEYRDLMKPQIREWLGNRNCWTVSGQIVPPDTGIEDDTHRIERREDGTAWQLVYTEDPNNHLARLGISVQEAEEMIA